jgi:hypothetical protein
MEPQMQAFRIYEHPVHEQKIVPMGFSWLVFFFGSLWALGTRTWVVLWAHVGMWLVVTGLRYGVENAMPDNKGWAVFFFYVVGIGVNAMISAEANPRRAQALEDRGYRLVKTLHGPTKDFVLAELERAKRQPPAATS